MSMGYSAIAIPDIKQELLHHGANSTSLFDPIETSSEQLNWFASSVNIGQLFGALIGGFFASAFGPRKAILIATVPNIIGWLTIAFSPSIYFLIIGRIMVGVGSCMLSANCSMLVSQFSSTSRRGIFLSLFTLMVSSGVLLVYMFGAVLNWRIVPVVPVSILLFHSCNLVFIPESPVWLLGHSGVKEAREALQWLRGTDDVEVELDNLRKVQEKQESALSLCEAFQNFTHPDVYKPVLLVVTNFILTMMAGPFAIVFYAVEIFQATGVQVDKYIATIIMGFIRVLGGVFAIFFIHKVPRVMLAAVSTAVMGFSMGLLGFAMFCQHVKYEFPGLTIIPLVAIILYTFGFGAGSGPLQWVWMGELIPPEYKVFAGISTSIATAAVFMVTLIFPTLSSYIHPHGTYWLFSAVCFLTCGFYLILMPETKGLSILQIRELFKKKENLKADESLKK
ncbi:facilitated trehalose transporter Tret1 isoform X2 [Eurytemora carolleeae]|nr:facilitated trehalose transporter Tret1 isoform X2 [Eurytemora carolleeae]|eukprot:XP_023336801.1 facilitated trehalose transporter Tret1-like isoform X2 [Eurytemora affinis]